MCRHGRGLRAPKAPLFWENSGKKGLGRPEERADTAGKPKVEAPERRRVYLNGSDRVCGPTDQVVHFEDAAALLEAASLDKLGKEASCLFRMARYRQ